MTQPKANQSYLPWITYDETDILQARGTVVVCCPADLSSYSALTRYVIQTVGIWTRKRSNNDQLWEKSST